MNKISYIFKLFYYNLNKIILNKNYKNLIERNYNGNKCYIDKGIYQCVDLMNKAGIKTLYSCQGYLEKNDRFKEHQSYSFIILDENQEFSEIFINDLLNFNKDFMARGKHWIQTFDYGDPDKQIEINMKFISFIENYFKNFLGDKCLKQGMP
ncbi:MAG: hypothetical protein K2X69_12985 [Silvanigrellaceae bacterium]|nr:hypothetical protein [Silvanigrellaceae bacterium]